MAGEGFAPVESDGDRLGLEVEVIAGGVVGVSDEAPSGVLGEVVRGLRVKANARHAQKKPSVNRSRVDVLDAAEIQKFSVEKLKAFKKV